MPRIREADQGRPYRAAWYASIDPKGGPPLPGGPVGVTFTCLLRIEPGNGRIEALALEPGMGINEPVHVPSASPDHEGWLMAVVDRATGDVMAGEYESELWIVDAGQIGGGPVARIPIPLKQRSQVHGWWVSAAELAKARHQA